jgi:hypothetical protein
LGPGRCLGGLLEDALLADAHDEALDGVGERDVDVADQVAVRRVAGRVVVAVDLDGERVLRPVGAESALRELLAEVFAQRGDEQRARCSGC